MASVDPSLVYDDTLAAVGSGPTPRRGGNSLAAGQIVGGRYRVGRLLGSGGMGLVFEGTHLELGSPVAIKIVRPQFSQDSQILERFVNEARNVAALTSPHIARVFDAGKMHTGEAYLVMERLVGQDLGSVLSQSGPIPWPLAVSYVAQACEGLADAHAHGLVHRDLKPEHLFVVQSGTSPPLVKLLDFGISKNIRQAEARMTLPGDSIGSPLYMSPEQIQNPALVDERTDLWSLGVVLYECLTGKLPFDGNSVAQVQWQVIGEDPQPLAARCPNAPPMLEAILLRCLAKSPAERMASADELRRELRALLEPALQPSPAPAIAVQLAAPALSETTAPNETAASSETAQPISVGLSEARALVFDEAPTSEELHAAGVPKSHGRGPAVLMATGFALALVALGSVSLGGFDDVKAWGQGLAQNENPSRVEYGASSWTPPLVLPMLKGGSTDEPTVTPVAASPEPAPTRSLATALEAAASEPEPEPKPAATAKPAPKPAAVATPRAPRQEPGEPAPSREQIEARYQEWLKQEHLKPVGDVTLDEALSHPEEP